MVSSLESGVAVSRVLSMARQAAVPSNPALNLTGRFMSATWRALSRPAG